MKFVFVTLAGIFLLAANVFAGSIVGTVTYNGEVPNYRPISMMGDPICAAEHKDHKTYPQTLILGPNKTLANTLVYVKSGLPKQKYPVPSQPAVLNQQGCNYSPHVLALQAGQTLEVLNPDHTLHNVHFLSKVNREVNLAMPAFRTQATVVFKKSEPVFQVRCDVHPWMQGWIAVMDNPFFSVTAPDGQFSLKGLPDGTYQIEAWHERLGTKVMTVTVKDGNAQTVNVAFDGPKSTA